MTEYLTRMNELKVVLLHTYEYAHPLDVNLTNKQCFKEELISSASITTIGEFQTLNNSFRIAMLTSEATICIYDTR